MEEITSLSNSLVKETAKLHQKKYRDESGKFILEGYKAIEEAVNSGIDIEYLFVNKEKAFDYEFFSGKKILTTDGILKKISETVTPPDAVGVAKQKHYDKSDFKNLKKVVLLEKIKDPGNLGTILRTARAFNVDGIVLYGNCVDLYNSKCVRSSVGYLWKIPVINLFKLNDLQELFSNYQRVATLPLAQTFLKNFKVKNELLLMFGSEADGLSDELKNFASESVRIETNKDVESLNLAISCAVVLYSLIK